MEREIIINDESPDEGDSTAAAEIVAAAGALAEQLDDARQEGHAEAIGEAYSQAAISAALDGLRQQFDSFQGGVNEWLSKLDSQVSTLSIQVAALETMERQEAQTAAAEMEPEPQSNPESAEGGDVLQVQQVEPQQQGKGRRRTLRFFR
jgi:flagellar biosynthesis/type III secretory pathway protein FliH